MTKKSNIAVTAHYDFHQATRYRENLFSVRGGIPLNDAFNELSLLLAAVESATDALAKQISSDDTGSASPWTACHVLELCNALVQSMHHGLIEFEKDEV